MPDELVFPAVGLTAFVVWLPAFAACAWAARRAYSVLRRRGIPDWLSRGVAGGAVVAILLTYLPVYLFIMFFLFELGVFGSSTS